LIVDVKISGITGLLKSLDGLDRKVRKKVLVPASKAAGEVIAKRASKLARRRFGILARNIGVVVRNYHNPDKTVAIVGPQNVAYLLKKTGKKTKSRKVQLLRAKQRFKLTGDELAAYKVATTKGKGESWYKPSKIAHLIERGHVARNGKRVKAFPFMRPAWDAGKNEALDVYERELKAGIEAI
jgi:hypothetical protein